MVGLIIKGSRSVGYPLARAAIDLLGPPTPFHSSKVFLFLLSLGLLASAWRWALGGHVLDDEQVDSVGMGTVLAVLQTDLLREV